ncbi:hypothetical protein QEG98_32285 [Myxococcus sp. MxC21-1]|nr:hypothetical protein QEG98_32285 [Myxococcus sp. MxC21-1]
MSPAALLSALLLTAAPSSPGQKAKSLAASRAWEELYLAFSAGEASDVPTPQRSTVATALQKGCEALKDEDPVMAYSLGERATVYEESAGALRCRPGPRGRRTSGPPRKPPCARGWPSTPRTAPSAWNWGGC